MIEFIHKEFDRTLNNTEWMDENTKSNAYNKSKMIKFIVGYTNEVMNDTLINKSYENVSLKELSIYWDLNLRIFSIVSSI